MLNLPRWICATLILALVSANVLAATAAPDTDAPSVAEAQTVAGPARPKLRQDGEFRLRSNDGVEYRLYYYFQHNGGLSKLDSHVFYPPPYHLVVDEGGDLIKYDFDEDTGDLTLWVRQATNSNEIAAELRRQLARVAVREHRVRLEDGTDPYRVGVLPLTSAYFQLTKSERKSREFVAGVQEGDIAIYFSNLSRGGAENIIEDLQDNTTQLSFQYAFGAISEEKCIASFEGGGVQDIDLFKRLNGKGGDGLVSRHQVVQIADDLAEQEIFKVRCPEPSMLPSLTDVLLRRLEGRKERNVASWEELDRLIAFDADSFKADITNSLNTIENEVIREEALAAFSDASSQAASTAVEAGASGSFGPFQAAMEGSYASSTSEAQAQAKRAYTDALAKRGISVEWSGWRSVPKTVDAHSVADLDTKWARDVTFEYSIPGGQTGRGALLLGADDRTAAMSSEERRAIDHRLQQLKPIVEASYRLQEMEAMVRASRLLDIVHIDVGDDGRSFGLVRSEDADADGDNDESAARFWPGYLELRATGGKDDDGDTVETFARFESDDLELHAYDDVDVEADDVDIDAEDRVTIESRKVVPEKQAGHRGKAGVRIRTREGAPVHISSDGYLIIDAKGIIFNGREVRL